MKISTLMLALAGLSTVAFACTEGESFCADGKRAVKCVGGVETPLYECDDNMHCVTLRPLPNPYCEYGPPASFASLYSSTTLAPTPTPTSTPVPTVTDVLPDPSPTCTDGDKWCDNGKTAMVCINGTEHSLYDCASDKHCVIIPTHPVPWCADGSPVNPTSLSAASPATPTPSPAKCEEFGRWCSSNTTISICLNGTASVLHNCPENHHCEFSPFKTYPRCVYNKRALAACSTTLLTVAARDIPNAQTPTAEPTADVSAAYRCTEGQLTSNGRRCYQCSNNSVKVIWKCERHHECSFSNNQPHCTRILPASAGQSAVDTGDAITTADLELSTLDTRDDDGAACGFCTSMRGLNAPLRTSNLTCRNHPELDGEYQTCVNEWCGLCIIFSERDCQGDIKWSGGRGQNSGDRKGQHGKSHFCY
ncbi:hypothetical protein T440DRAFT_508141 [Plenodomus tracheiphilus IPT5]|uniref:Uncharacterized protein n=1 Tax=Plenodomus tracheiphilus IPT5 TaxID=1408161 RepID=A0A6A7B551_9PLEO|nr:hypothetical protein T440DRAFT_508141 [Plenodomus tracheiphilus IPT5]